MTKSGMFPKRVREGELSAVRFCSSCLSEVNDVNSGIFREGIRPNFLISAICVAEPMIGGDF